MRRGVIHMRKFLYVFAALLCLPLTAAAQDSAAGFDATSSAAEPAAPASLLPADRDPWQVGASFQYLHFSALGVSFYDLGFRGDVTRYLNNWFGVEGTAIAGFGHTGTTPNLVANSVFLGGGPHVAIPSGRRIEPWFHVLAGWERLRFTQTNTLGAPSSVAFMGGIGLDYKWARRAFWRVQGDYLGTHYNSKFNSNYSIGVGFVFNF